MQGLVAQEIVRTKIIEPVSNARQIHIFLHLLHHNHVQVLALEGEVFFQLHAKAPGGKVIHQQQAEQSMPGYLHEFRT
jgi:hypothetical protein